MMECKDYDDTSKLIMEIASASASLTHEKLWFSTVVFELSQFDGFYTKHAFARSTREVLCGQRWFEKSQESFARQVSRCITDCDARRPYQTQSRLFTNESLQTLLRLSRAQTIHANGNIIHFHKWTLSSPESSSDSFCSWMCHQIQ